MADGTDGEPDLPPAPAAGPGYVKAARFEWLTPVYDLLVVTLAREQQWKRQLVPRSRPSVACASSTSAAGRVRSRSRWHTPSPLADWGRPQDPLMRLLSLAVRILDGSASTRDSLAGALPSLLAGAGFADVRETGAWRTPIGTLRTVSAIAPPDRPGRGTLRCAGPTAGL